MTSLTDKRKKNIKLIEITQEETQLLDQYFIYNTLTERWSVDGGPKGIALSKYASPFLKYYEVKE